MHRQISVVYSNKYTYEEEFVSKKLSEAQINQALSSKIKQALFHVLDTYQNAFDSDNEPLGTMKGHEVDIDLNINRPYPPVLRRLDFPASPKSREGLEKHIQELIKSGVLRKLSNN
ncbi:hypothetical protein O181_074932 [Austropuccinia psidii MF-1]|uniref:Uncharacterized protein n=1 Tax=Austropuccinia psidii MF-1 TaxID=1389203 RepID=A0A9Q3FDZ2_9BASI|nr:hypothetical protein [Austropuccinia psidii MF-1]